MITYKNLKLDLLKETKHMLTYEVRENDVILGVCEVYTQSKFLNLAFQLNINMDEDYLTSIVNDLTNYFNEKWNQ